MRALWSGLLILVAMALQASLLNSALPVRVDFLLVLAIAWAAGTGPRKGMLFGFAAGAAQDLVTGCGLTFTLTKAFLGWLSGGIKPLIYYRQTPIVLPLVALGTVIHEVVLWAALWLTGRGVPWDHVAGILFPAAIANALVAWPVYSLIRWILHKTRDPYALREA